MAVINGKIKCSGCKHQKEISCFTPFIVRRGSGLCKPCRNAYKKQLYHRDVEKARKQYKEYRIKKGPEWKKNISQKSHKKHGKKYALKQYGITLEQYLEMLKKQNNSCAICGRTENSDGKKLYVDHCHVTKKIRGVLCRKCNTGIGLLGDTLDSVRKAYEYMIKSERNNERDM